MASSVSTTLRYDEWNTYYGDEAGKYRVKEEADKRKIYQGNVVDAPPVIAQGAASWAEPGVYSHLVVAIEQLPLCSMKTNHRGHYLFVLIRAYKKDSIKPSYAAYFSSTQFDNLRSILLELVEKVQTGVFEFFITQGKTIEFHENPERKTFESILFNFKILYPQIDVKLVSETYGIFDFRSSKYHALWEMEPVKKGGPQDLSRFGLSVEWLSMNRVGFDKECRPFQIIEVTSHAKFKSPEYTWFSQDPARKF